MQITEYVIEARDELKASALAAQAWSESDRGAHAKRPQVGRNSVRIVVNGPSREEERKAVELVCTVLAQADKDMIEQGMGIDYDELEKAAEIVAELA